jgi:hypothetical protein
VIGFALFLGYSLTYLGPSGKVLIGLAAGLSLLFGGVALSRMEAYRGYSYTVMGAGWAVVFFTAYAAHGVPEARLIESTVAGAVALLAVTALMIGHSVFYRSETATGLACLLGFIGLNVSPLTRPSVLATMLLALSLTGLSYRFGWTRLPLLGVSLTYLTFALRYDPSIHGQAGLLNGQATLWTYWLTFEVFNLLALRTIRGQRSLFALNLTGFIGASILHEWRMNAADWSLFLGIAALAYLASALVRARLAEGSEDRGYEPAATAAALLMAGALIERFSGTAITTALLLEGQMVALIGRWLGSRWIAAVGGVVLGLSFFRLLAVDAFGSTAPRQWTPTGALMAAVFAANRWFAPAVWPFSVAAAVVAAFVVQEEAPRLWVAPLWAFAGAAAVATRRAELPWIGAGLLAMACGRAAIENIDTDIATSALVVLSLFAGQLLWRQRTRWIRPALCGLGTVLLTALLSERVTGGLLTVWFGIEGAALLAAGFLVNERPFRLAGLAVFLLCIGKLFLHDLRQLDTLSRILSFVVLGVVMMAASWLYTRYRDKVRRLL